MSLSKLWVLVKDKEVWHATVHGATKTGDTPEQLNNWWSVKSLANSFLVDTPHGSECIHCLNNFIPIISVDLSSLSKYSGTFGQRAYLLSPWHQTQMINHPFHPFLKNSVILMARIPDIPSKLGSAEFYLTWIQSRLLVVIFWINVIIKSSMVSLGSWGKNVIIN